MGNGAVHTTIFSRTAFVLTAISVAALTMCLGGSPALAGSTKTELFGPTGSVVTGETAPLAALVKGDAPTGTVTFKEGGKTLGKAKLGTSFGTQTTIAAGGWHTCAVRDDGAVVCWGKNASGELGRGASFSSAARVEVVGLSSGVVSVVTGNEFACALTDAGGVQCWGNNDDGQLGNGTKDNRDTPVKVKGLQSGVAAIGTATSGGDHACAVTTSGAAKCWGDNGSGALGNGDFYTDESTPVQVKGLTSGVVAIATGMSHTCALTAAGAMKCWGANSFGQLGNGPWDGSTAYLTPTQVKGLTSGVVAIATGSMHTCALTKVGAVQCWGENDDGELGTGDTNERSVPTQVRGLTSGVVAIAAGRDHTCALTRAGALKCWGDNTSGQLGNDTTYDSSTPVQVDGLTSGVVSIGAGGAHTCAVLEDGDVKCWGYNNEFQLGYDNTSTGSETPVTVADLSALTPARDTARAVLSGERFAAGKHTIKASYGGGSGNGASTSSTLTLKVGQGKTKIKQIKVSPKTPKAGKTARVKVAMKAVSPASGKPTGKILVKDGKKTVGKYKVKNGKAGFKLGKLSKGKHALKLTFKGDRNWGNSAAKKTVKVK